MLGKYPVIACALCRLAIAEGMKTTVREGAQLWQAHLESSHGGKEVQKVEGDIEMTAASPQWLVDLAEIYWRTLTTISLRGQK